MAASVNKVILIGNLGDDPKIITGQNGKFAELSIATSESWRDKSSGERKEVTDWHRVKVFSEPLVKFAEQYLKKGHKVYVEGKQKTRKWEKDGVAHYSTDVVLANFGGVLVSLQSSGGRSDSPEDYGTTSSSSGGEQRKPARDADLNDDIPF